MEVRRLSRHADEGVWAITGDLDLFALADFWRVVEKELGAGHSLVLDLSHVTFLDSSGVGVLLKATKRGSVRGLRFALRTNASEPVMRILDVTGTRERFEWVSAGGDADGAAGVREPRRPYPSSGGASAVVEGTDQSGT